MLSSITDVFSLQLGDSDRQNKTYWYEIRRRTGNGQTDEPDAEGPVGLRSPMASTARISHRLSYRGRDPLSIPSRLA